MIHIRENMSPWFQSGIAMKAIGIHLMQTLSFREPTKDDVSQEALIVVDISELAEVMADIVSDVGGLAADSDLAVVTSPHEELKTIHPAGHTRVDKVSVVPRIKRRSGFIFWSIPRPPKALVSLNHPIKRSNQAIYTNAKMFSSTKQIEHSIQGRVLY